MVTPLPSLVPPADTAHPAAQPCVAHPHAGLVHRDGPCRCFVGGPAPEHEPERSLPSAS
jgi:hypothetical protein